MRIDLRRPINPPVQKTVLTLRQWREKRNASAKVLFLKGGGKIFNLFLSKTNILSKLLPPTETNQ
jgi:hypothetical protein